MERHTGKENEEFRATIRAAASEGASVEFKPSDQDLIHHLALRDWSDSGLGILVRKDSAISQRLRVGQVLNMMVHLGRAGSSHVQVEVRHISDPPGGPHPDHLIIGLHILARLASDLAVPSWESLGHD